MRLVITADTHFSSKTSEREMDIFDSIIEDATNSDGLVICGDLFDSPYPSSRMVSRLLYWFYQLAYKNVPVHIISGNHDISNVSNALDYLSFRDNLHIYREPYQTKIGKIQLGFLPYCRSQEGLVFDWNPDIIFYHGLIESAKISKWFRFTTGEEILSKESIKGITSTCKYFIAGDVHLHQKIEMDSLRAEYVGTPWQHKFSEEGYDTGYLVWEDGSLSFTKTLGTLHLTRFIRDEEEGVELLSQIKDSANLLRLRFHVEEGFDMAERKMLKRIGAISDIDVSFKEKQEGVSDMPKLEKEISEKELLPLFQVWLGLSSSDKTINGKAFQRATELIGA